MNNHRLVKELIKNRVSAVLISNGKILLIHRFKDGKEYWVLPGGGVEEGESNEVALDREVVEELSLRVLGKEYVFKIRNADRDEYHYLINKYSGKPELGGPEKEKMNDLNKYILEWVNISELNSLDNFYPQAAIKEILNLET